jgi:Flp pilus assembly protein TadB
VNLDEAKSLWASDAPTDDSSTADSETDMSSQTLSNSEILQLVQKKSGDFEERIRNRDLLESVAALCVIAFFGLMAWTSTGLERIGALIIVGAGLLIPVLLYRTRARHADLPADCSLKDRLHAEREKIEAQISLARSVAIWYLAPLATGLMIHVFGQSGWSWVTAICAGVVVGGSIVIYRRNQKAIRTDLRPRRDELTEMIEQVES